MCIVNLHTCSYSYTIYNYSPQNKEQKALGQLLNWLAKQNCLHAFYGYVDRIIHIYAMQIGSKMADNYFELSHENIAN